MTTKKPTLNLKDRIKPIEQPVEEPALPSLQYETGKVSAVLPTSLIEKILDFEYHEGYTHTTLIQEALEQFLKDKEIKPRPAPVKKMNRPGRKRKAGGINKK